MSDYNHTDGQQGVGGPTTNNADDTHDNDALHQLGQSMGLADNDIDLTKPLAPTHDENKGFMKFMPPLIKEMNRRGVPFTIDGNTGEITIDGFYKNGVMKLQVEDNNDIVAIDKRARSNVMASYDDLVKLNFQWWKMSTGKGIHITPDRPWLDEFIKNNWVKRQVIFVPREDQGPAIDDATA